MFVRKHVGRLTVAGILSCLPVAGYATDLPVKAPAHSQHQAPKSANWIGPYVGASAGYEMLTAAVNVANVLVLDGFGAK